MELKMYVQSALPSRLRGALRQNLTHCLGLAALLVALANPAQGANCPVGGTTVFFGNGVNTDILDALIAATALHADLRVRLQDAPAIDPACVEPALAYDPIPFASALANLAVQMGLIATVQVALQFAGDFSTWLNDLTLAPSWFVGALGQYIILARTLAAPVLAEHREDYTTQFLAGNKVIVVAHSQGNLYVNEVYNLLSAPDERFFSIVGVATPADHVAGGGPYVTLANDAITFVPGSLPPNTTNIDPPCSGDTDVNRIDCHAFLSSYLRGLSSRGAILTHVTDRIPVPLRVEKTGPGTGTVVSTPAGIDCGPSCTGAFPRVTNGNPTVVTLTATPDPGSAFRGWSGTCSAGTINGASIAFQMHNSTAQTCTAEFGSSTAASTIDASCQHIFIDFYYLNVYGILRGPNGSEYQVVLDEAATLPFETCGTWTVRDGHTCVNSTGSFSESNYVASFSALPRRPETRTTVRLNGPNAPPPLTFCCPLPPGSCP